MKRRYKVLPLPTWAGVRLSPLFDRSWQLCLEHCEVITPVFNRNGFYLDRKTGRAWIEREGKAWVYQDRKNFQFQLDNNPGNNRLENRVYEAIGVLVNEGIAGERLGNLYTVENFARYLQRTRYFGLRSLRRIRAAIKARPRQNA